MTLTVAIGLAGTVVAVGAFVGALVAVAMLHARSPERQVSFAVGLERRRAAGDAQSAIFDWFDNATRLSDEYDEWHEWQLDRERVVHLAASVREAVKEGEGMATKGYR